MAFHITSQTGSDLVLFGPVTTLMSSIGTIETRTQVSLGKILLELTLGSGSTFPVY